MKKNSGLIVPRSQTCDMVHKNVVKKSSVEHGEYNWDCQLLASPSVYTEVSESHRFNVLLPSGHRITNGVGDDELMMQLQDVPKPCCV